MRLQIKYDWIVSICCLGDGDARAAIDLFNHSHHHHNDIHSLHASQQPS